MAKRLTSQQCQKLQMFVADEDKGIAEYRDFCYPPDRIRSARNEVCLRIRVIMADERLHKDELQKLWMRHCVR